MSLLLGAIADDFTGATDLANTLVRGGMRTVQTIGVPPPDLDLGDATAAVVALKSRSIPASDAVRQSLDALAALQARGAKKFFFKYCSTFDSTDAGNIGPVADALLERLGSEMTIVCPAFPATGRRMFGGYLFVNDVLLSESGMQNHPLTPMTDSNLVRVLQRQTKHKVGLLDFRVVREGEAAVHARLEALRAEGVRHVIADAAGDEDLVALGLATSEFPLITGGSGMGLGMPDVFARLGLLAARDGAGTLSHIGGPSAILAGSCSRATLAQIAYVRERIPSLEIDVDGLDDPAGLERSALAWAREHVAGGTILISTSGEPEKVTDVQRRFGREEAGARIEALLAAVARGLHAEGIRRFIVAGGETSGAVVGALGVTALRIGDQIAPGVPWTSTVGPDPFLLALKSGNFGGEDFFVKAVETAP